MRTLFERFGIKAEDSNGQMFDPKKHEALTVAPSSQGDAGNDNVPFVGDKAAGSFDMESNNQTGGTNLEAFSNAGWVVFANNGGA
jgi:hypothetical protein